MGIVKPESLVYRVLSGAYEGKTCVIRDEKKLSGRILVVFIDGEPGMDTLVPISHDLLEQLEIPGWPFNFAACYGSPYGFDGYTQNWGNGTNMLRTPVLSQPNALLPGDVLATGEKIVAPLRAGFNSIPLINLNRSGWVEVTSRLPVALADNTRYKLAGALARNDRLATGCLVVQKPTFPETTWASVCLDREDCHIDVPVCIPLALAQ